jgi:hypothetical protein
LEDNVQAQGQAEFAALSFELPVSLAAMMNFEKPPCPLVPCSALFGDFCRLVIIFSIFSFFTCCYLHVILN